MTTIKEIRERCERAKLPVGHVFDRLDEKYYGTLVQFDKVGSFNIWFGHGDDDEPTPTEQDKAVLGDGYRCDNHYQDVADLYAAQFFAHASADVRYLLSALTARDALLKRCAEMLRKHDRCDHDGQGFDETCPECHAFMDTDPHLESCPYAALMREIEDAK